MVYVYSTMKRRMQRRNAGRDARTCRGFSLTHRGSSGPVGDIATRGVQHLGEEKSGTVAGSTPGMRRFGSVGMGVRP